MLAVSLSAFDPKLPFGLAGDLTAHLGVPIPITGGELAHEAMQLFWKRAKRSLSARVTPLLHRKNLVGDVVASL
jgi:hypothetical protein